MADTDPYWDLAGHGDLEPGGPMPPPATDEDIEAWDARKHDHWCPHGHVWECTGEPCTVTAGDCSPLWWGHL